MRTPDFFRIEFRFYVYEHTASCFESPCPGSSPLSQIYFMGHGDDQSIQVSKGVLLVQCKAIFFQGFFGVRKVVYDDGGDAVILQFRDDVRYTAVAKVGYVFLEGDAQDAHFGIGDREPFLA